MNLNGKVSNPGELRTQVTLKKRTTASGSFTVPGWTTLASVWAKWVNLHGTEVWAAQAEQASAAATVTIRYRNDVDASCGVEKGGQLYEIVSVDDIQERHEYLELKVRRVLNG